MTTSQKGPRLLEGPLWVSAFIGFTLLIVCGAAYMAILQEEASNPRRTLLAGLWPSVAVGDLATEVIEVMGPPDKDEVFARCPSPGDAATRDSNDPVSIEASICVREYTWYSWRERGAGQSYSVCVDDDGTVLRKSTAMTFHLRNW